MSRSDRGGPLPSVQPVPQIEHTYLSTPGMPDHAQHRQAVANARELRLLLLNLPDIQEHDQHQREHALAPTDAEVLDGPGLIETEPVQSCPYLEQSGQFQTNLTTSATNSQASTENSLRSPKIHRLRCQFAPNAASSLPCPTSADIDPVPPAHHESIDIQF